MEARFIAVCFRHLGSGLSEVDLLGLETLGPAFHDKSDFGAFVERAVTGCLNSRKMDEYILAIFTSQESKSFGRVEPLYCSCFFHIVLFSSNVL